MKLPSAVFPFASRLLAALLALAASDFAASDFAASDFATPALTTSAFAQQRGKPFTLPSGLPKGVLEAVEKNNKECTEGKPGYVQGFLSTRDINGDGKPDYVLNYGFYRCGDIETLFCGTGGCQTEIFASDGEGGYVHVWDKLAQKVEFKTIGKRPAMTIHLHGSKCGRNNSERCAMTLYWNGEEFHPAN